MDNSEITVKELNDYLLSILECPICFNYMKPPIVQCTNGHSVCRTCRTKLMSCSTCRENFAGRNLTMERITEVVMYPCKYASEGCEVEVRLKYKGTHGQVCDFRLFPCLLSDCGWKSCRSEYSEHLHSAHNNKLFVGSSQITEVLMYPCKYESDGCNKKIRSSDKTDHEDLCEYRPFQCPFQTCEKKFTKRDYFMHLESVHHHQSVNETTKMVDLPLTSSMIYEWLVPAWDQMFTVKLSVADPYIHLWPVLHKETHMEDDKYYFTFHIKHHKRPYNSALFSGTLDILGSKNFIFPLELAKIYAGDSDSLPIEIKVTKSSSGAVSSGPIFCDRVLVDDGF